MLSHDPLYIFIEVILLIGTSAVCSGLNVALMALDIRDLRRKAKLGNKAARKMLPLREDVHLTLASILFTNVAAVAATSVVLEARFNGLLAILFSTILLVIFGEIMPQALFGKDPLKWTSRLYPVLKLMRVITYPVSRPLQILLDKLFPRSEYQLQSRRELGLLITEHLGAQESELDEDEVEIIRGALQLSEKKVRDIMTDIRHTYWLTPDTELTDEKIDEIKRQGYSRIPIFNKRLTKSYGVLLMKDLVDVDFDDNNYRVDDMPLHPTQLVGSMTALDTMFRKFISARTHLIPVEKDDQIIGIVTIEDLLEEIVGHEIEDETDRVQRSAK
jgi:metal transporter CNNM